MLCIPRYFSACAAYLVYNWSCTACGIQFPLCTRSVGLAGMFTDDQLYDLSFCMAMSTPNITQNAEMMSACLCSDSSAADGVMRSFM